jgi:two-component system, NarL family, response regulator NreC
VKPIRILLADDHNVIRRGLRVLLETQAGFSVVAEAADGVAAVEQAITHRPDVVVLDIAMPRLAGTDAAERIAAEVPSAAIVILSMHADEGYVLRALKAGAKAYLLKDSAEGDLIDAIRVVSEGKAFFSPEVSRMLVEDYVREIKTRGAQDSYELLTSREREVLHLLAEGKSNKDIATLLNLSQYTVETHRRNIQEKLNLHSLAELILYAVRKGVIS